MLAKRSSLAEGQGPQCEQWVKRGAVPGQLAGKRCPGRLCLTKPWSRWFGRGFVCFVAAVSCYGRVPTFTAAQAFATALYSALAVPPNSSLAAASVPVRAAA